MSGDTTISHSPTRKAYSVSADLEKLGGRHSVASTPPEPGLHQPAVVRVRGCSHGLLLIVQHRTQHGAGCPSSRSANSSPVTRNRKGRVLLGEKSFLHACFVQHEKTSTLASYQPQRGQGPKKAQIGLLLSGSTRPKGKRSMDI